MTNTLSLFPDTNLFLQCKSLGEVDWTLLGHQGDIELLITRPVQTELDSLKAKGNSRQASKSRSAAALIAALLDAPEQGLVLKNNPTVWLRMARALRPDPSATDDLNYDSRDDQLVGIALAFHRAHSDASVMLLTYDNGPMFSARTVGLPFKRIPDEWLLPPEPDDADRRESALKAELERYKKSEPKFEVSLLNMSGQAFELTFTTYSPLSENDINSFLARIFVRYPEATDFGPSEPWERAVHNNPLATALFGEEKETFTPASSEEIEHYKRRYAEWKEVCRSYLQDIHQTLNQHLDWPTLTTRITNIGSRPADDSLVELEAKGALYIVRPRWRDNKDEDQQSAETPKFPRPPIVPSGHRKRIKRASPFPLYGASDPRASISSAQRFHVAPLRNFQTSRDPNHFYWKDGKQEVPNSYLSLTCAQWRHAREPEDFTIGLRFPRELGSYSGSLTVTVHAANLTNPTRKTLPIRVTVAETSPHAEIVILIEELEELG